MSKHKSYPHYRINVKDNSIADVIYNEVLPVHRPIYVMRTERGEINKPIWCASYNDAVSHFGRATFDESSKYFSLQALFLKNTFTYNGAFIMRVVDETAARKAFVILEANVTTDYDVPQYEVDDEGNRLLSRNLDPNSPNYGMLEYVQRTETTTSIEQGPQYDAYGNVLKDAYGNVITGDVEVTTENPITEKGIRIRWRTRVIYGGVETGLDDLRAETVGTNEVSYPVMAFEALTPGAYGNGLGFSLFYDHNQNIESVIEEYKSVFYTVELGEKEPNDSTITPIILNNSSLLTFAVNVNAVNKAINVPYNMEGILTRAFNSNNKKMPFNIYTYEENLRIIGNKIVEAELNRTLKTNGGLHFIDEDNYMDFEGISLTAGGFVVDPTSPAGYYVNVISGVNVKGISYDHVLVDKEDESPDAATLQNKSYIYLSNGADGAEVNEETGDDYVNEAFKKFLRGQSAEIVDSARYPITHLYDVGFPMATKLEMVEFLGLRDDVVVELSTQDASQPLNTKDLDEVNGQFLRTRALLQMESIEMGTDCCRCAIYTQAGMLNSEFYHGIVPFTFWSAMMHARYGNGQVMSSKEPRGIPYAVNEYFKSYNWLNFTPIGQAYAWDLGLNYCQAADMTRIFYPSLRTVYRADSSVLTDQWFVDALVYTKHIVRQAWATHVGRNDPSDVINAALETYLTNALTALYNGKYTFTVVVTQNEEEKRLGYIRHAYIRIVSPATFRVLEVDIEVNRENYNQENEEQ